MTERVDVVVIGAGAMGSSTAWWLARRGRTVVLAEQFGPGHRAGSSHGGVRIFRLAYPDAHYSRLAQAALPLWRELEADSGEQLVELTGAYDHGPTGTIAPIADALTAAGAEFELLDADAARERVPGLRFDAEVLFHPMAGRCFADRTVATLARRVGELGGEVRYDCQATIVEVGSDGVTVDLGDRTVHATRVVVTAGAWVERVLGERITLPPLAVTQEMVLHFRPLDDTAAWPSFIHHASPFRYGLHTPNEGLKVGGHHEGAVTNVDERSYDLHPAKVEAVQDYVRVWVPGVDPTPQFGTTCLYTTTSNEDFVLDRIGPIVVGSPCSGHGFKFTPIIGRMLADLADGVDLDPAIAARHQLAAFA